MTISIVIPAYNEEKYIAACIESVLKYKTKDVVEVIVVDNASTDATAAVAGAYPGVHVVREPNKGITWARQRGFLTATGDLIAYVDADSRVHETWVDDIVREFSRDEKVVCLSGPFKFYDIPKWKSTAIRAVWLSFAMPHYWHTKFMALGANLVIKRKALEEIGGFDTTIAFHGEDTNIARRLHDVGRVRWTPSFYNYSSARRLQAEGLAKSGMVYALNFISQAYMNKVATKEYKDHRS